MKVSELEGAALDYWVARANGKNPAIADVVSQVAHYSTNAVAAVRIIERERLVISPLDNEDGWIVAHSRDGFGSKSMTGPTLLIAAMRCFVASKYGEEVKE